MDVICNSVMVLEFLFQGYCQYTYLSALLKTKLKKEIVIFVFLAASCIEYCIYYFLYNPLINIALVTVLCFSVCMICFEAHWGVKALHSCILSCMLVLCEMAVIPFSNFFMNDNYFETHLKISELLISTISKLVMFTICMIIKQVAQKEIFKTRSIWLFAVPLFTIVLIHSICMLSNIGIDVQTYNYVLIISFVSLIIINTIVFIVHESYVMNFKETEKLKLLEQKKNLDYDHYKLLQQSYDNSRILVHDFKHHLSVINSLTQKGDQEELKNYLGSLEQSDIVKNVSMTGNKIVDVVIAQKAEQCRMIGIDFIFHPNNINLDFAEEVDICCILSNILNNAIEAAEKSVEKRIKMEFYSNEDDSIVFIETENSSDHAPNYKKGKIITSKKEKSKHGIGMVSIENSLKKYKGEMDHKYSEETKVFTLSVMMHKA